MDLFEINRFESINYEIPLKTPEISNGNWNYPS